MITWDSAAHFFATAWHDVVVGAEAVARHNAQVQAVGIKVEQIEIVGTLVPPTAGISLLALEITRLSMFAFGAVCQLILVADGDEAKAAKDNPGIHPDLFTQAKQLMAQYPQLVDQAKSLVRK
jgi:hypothetical protein